MTIEILRALITIAIVLGSATFILAAIRLVFYFGQLVRGQDHLSKQVEIGAASFTKFAEEIRDLLADHEDRINGLETDKAVREKVDEDREKRQGKGRRGDP